MKDKAALSYRSREVWQRLPRVFLPMLAFLLAGPVIVVSRDRMRDRSLLRLQSHDVVQLQARILERELESVTSTLLHFAEQKILRDFLQDRSVRADLENEYIRFCRVSGVFDQVRLIDEEGYEALRINYEGGDPKAVPVAQLQSKSDRYYVRFASLLARSEVYVSRFDLNLEHGRIENPPKPVLRLATPVFDGGGRKRGILVLNYLGASLLERLESVSLQAPGWTGLVDKDGFYLQGPDPERSWGFMYGREPSFAADHPEAWGGIRDRHEDSFMTNEGMFTFRTIAPVGRLRLSTKDFPVGMRIVSFVPRDAVYAASRHTFQNLAVGVLFIALVLFGVAWRLAYVGSVREDHERKISASEKRLRTLSSRLIDAQETERKSLARDLHDEVGQLATAITINLKRAQRSEEVGAKDELIDRSLQETGRLLDSMHRIAARVRSSVLDDLGLEAALRSCSEDFERDSRVPVRVDLDIQEELLPDRVAESVYRIVQEALTNVSRHANAEGVTVSVQQVDGRIDVSVRDRGVGFDPGSADPTRIGLLGMRERAELLGGTFLVESAPSLGTKVNVSIPLKSPEAEE